MWGCMPHEMVWCALMGVCGVAEGTPSSVAHCTLRCMYPRASWLCSEPVCTARPILVYYFRLLTVSKYG